MFRGIYGVILNNAFDFLYSSETSKYIIEVLGSVKQENREAFIEKLIDELTKRNSKKILALSLFLKIFLNLFLVESFLKKEIVADVVKEINFDVKESM